MGSLVAMGLVGSFVRRAPNPPIALPARLGYTLAPEMSRLAVQRLLTMLTLALVMVLPLRARAALVPVCDDDRMTPAPVVMDPSCTPSAEAEDAAGQLNAAPICDPQGASAVAPQRILPVSDARIEALASCGGGELGPTIGPRSDGSSAAGELSSTPPQALLPEHLVLPAPGALVTLCALARVEGGPLPGVRRDVARPPR